MGGAHPTEKAKSLLDLSNPTIDWVKIAEGMGMTASRAETVDQFNSQFADAMGEKGPRLIEVILPGYENAPPT